VHPEQNRSLNFFPATFGSTYAGGDYSMRPQAFPYQVFLLSVGLTAALLVQQPEKPAQPTQAPPAKLIDRPQHLECMGSHTPKQHLLETMGLPWLFLTMTPTVGSMSS
jgi:hypothetical protein